jgi:hypothetical protein
MAPGLILQDMLHHVRAPMSQRRANLDADR